MSPLPRPVPCEPALKLARPSIVNLCARLFPPNVSVAADHSVDRPFFGQGRFDDVVQRVLEGARVSSPRGPIASVSVGVGVREPGLDLYCSGGIWNVRLSRDQSRGRRGRARRRRCLSAKMDWLASATPSGRWIAATRNEAQNGEPASRAASRSFGRLKWFHR